MNLLTLFKTTMDKISLRKEFESFLKVYLKKFNGDERNLRTKDMEERESFVLNNEEIDLNIRILFIYLLRRNNYIGPSVSIPQDQHLDLAPYLSYSYDNLSYLYNSGRMMGLNTRISFSMSMNHVNKYEGFNPYLFFAVGSLGALKGDTPESIFKAMKVFLMYSKKINVSFAINITSTEKYLDESVKNINGFLEIAKKEGYIGDFKYLEFKKFTNSYAGALNYSHYFLVGPQFSIEEIVIDESFNSKVRSNDLFHKGSNYIHEYLKDKSLLSYDFFKIPDLDRETLNRDIFSLDPNSKDKQVFNLKNPMNTSGNQSYCCGDYFSYRQPVGNGKNLGINIIDKSIKSDDDLLIVALALLYKLKSSFLQNSIKKQISLISYDKNMWKILDALGFEYKFSTTCDKSGIVGRFYVFTKEIYKEFLDSLKPKKEKKVTKE
jgi:hypothetical protein